ncbi:hypothetical protein KAM429_37880 [Aquipseudomonas alcaligenes]|uniref:Uncharacterized protein n=1 Tax=Aquipseudomonas alcaligenes TaxID=43263 RepID=A0AA37FMD2_AQUAC|nr:hypothetical protein KAM426_15610 [Pseudomonas alcaligenes]GIZ68695.1 hypothetical protein KAM428_37800 [Pseudomonas alcaligenes]GIZ73027.1 hypothetical protein KAM429_37880 [Pseudomonas alcaligenes]GIZ77429.1 hypothetical protein KAM430_38380 [Pseudomonas alcaligenes]GIZ81687.1 hypothetical protein KAM432_37350 [Pseudomonas alcaligenes]
MVRRAQGGTEHQLALGGIGRRFQQAAYGYTVEQQVEGLHDHLQRMQNGILAEVLRRQRRQPIGGACRVAMLVVPTIFPAGGELATGAGALLIHAAARATADLALQRDATHRFARGTAHGDMVGSDLLDPLIGHGAAGGLAFAPIEGHAKIGAAGTTTEARMGFGHGRATE